MYSLLMALIGARGCSSTLNPHLDPGRVLSQEFIVGLCKEVWRSGPSRTGEEGNGQDILTHELERGQPKKTNLLSYWRGLWAE